jgi:chromosome transmission fidelity protein 18
MQAHIVARQAGYKPMEINASDDRSSKTIRERIADAQAMQSVFGW